MTQKQWNTTAAVDTERKGIVRFSDGDAFDGLLAGARAQEIVDRFNAAPRLLKALQLIIDNHVPKANPFSDAAILSAAAAISSAKGEDTMFYLKHEQPGEYVHRDSLGEHDGLVTNDSGESL